MTRHVIGSIIVLLSILLLPYWIYIPVLFVAIITVPFFWEGMLFALMIEAMYTVKISIFTPLISPLTVSTLILLIILLPIREKIRLHV